MDVYFDKRRKIVWKNIIEFEKKSATLLKKNLTINLHTMKNLNLK